MAKVAIITRTKNRPVLLERTLKSVAAQSFKDWHHVVINDGGNPDVVEEVCMRFKDTYGSRLQIIHNKKSIGMEAASNKAIKACTSEYVVVLDDDDTWDSTFLEKCIKEFSQIDDNRFKGIVTLTQFVHERLVDDQPILVENIRNTNLPSLILSDILMRDNFQTNAFLYKREVFDIIGYYDETLPVAGDWEFNIRFLSNFDIWLYPEYLANYHVRVDTDDKQYQNHQSTREIYHRNYETMLRNQWLRNDIKSNSIGLGWYSVFCKDIEKLGKPISKIDIRVGNIDHYLKNGINFGKKIPLIKHVINMVKK